jgi:hypothetical protein
MYWRINRVLVHLKTLWSVSQLFFVYSLGRLFFSYNRERERHRPKRWNIVERKRVSERKRKETIWINAIIRTRTSKGERDTSTMGHPSNRLLFSFSLSFFFLFAHIFYHEIWLASSTTTYDFYEFQLYSIINENSHGSMMILFQNKMRSMCFEQRTRSENVICMFTGNNHWARMFAVNL